jgi:PAS domain S-box-containing protein
LTRIKRYIEDYLFAFSAFFIVLLLTILTFLGLRRWTEEKRKNLFQIRTSQATEKVVSRVNDYIQILKAGKAMFVVKDTVTRQDWKFFYIISEVEKNYPGIQAIGYTPFIRNEAQMKAFQAKMAKEGVLKLRGNPEWKGEQHTPIMYLEPDNWRNRRALGFDMFSESVRRHAMETARDSAEATLSGVLTLVQETQKDVQEGVLLYLPVYQSNKTGSLAKPADLIRGFVYSAFRARDLFSGILSGSFNDLNITVSGIDGNGNLRVLYSGSKEYERIPGVRLRKVEYLNIAGQLWKISYESTPFLGSYSDRTQPYVILSAGSVISVLIFFIFWFISKTRKTNRILNTVTSNATAGLLMVDSEGYCTFINQSGQEMLGVTHDEIRRIPLNQIVFDKSSVGEGKKLPAGLKTSYEEVLIRKDGTPLNVFISSRPVYSATEPVFTIIEVRDISEEKRSAEQIKIINENLRRKNEELKRINTDLDNFVYTASHDLKAPVSNIEGLINALEEAESIKSGKSDGAEIIELIKKSIFRFKNTIQDLTDITRMQKNFENLQEPVDVSLIVNEVLEDLSLPIRESGGKITVEVNEPYINFSKSNLKSLIYNLLSNSVKYRSSERLLECKLSVYKSGVYTVLEVADNGLGIPEQLQSKVFGMFKRAHSHVEGSGIGLYIVKRMIENAGGYIELESREGVGTIFRIYFKN